MKQDPAELEFPAPLRDACEFLMEECKRLGVAGVEVHAAVSTSAACRSRNKQREQVEFADQQGISLRVLAEVRSEDGKAARAEATGGASDTKREALCDLAARIVAMARLAPADPWLSLASASELAPACADAEVCAPTSPSEAQLLEACRAMEEAGLEGKHIEQSEGAEAAFVREVSLTRGDNGLELERASTYASLSVALVAGRGEEMQVDWEAHTRRDWSDLDAPDVLGAKAAARAAARMHPQTPKSGQADVLFEPRVAGAFVSALASAANGDALARGTSFLCGREGEPILPTHLRIIDDPHAPRGLASRTRDDEGLASAALVLFADGVFQAPLLDLAAARRLGLPPSANAYGEGDSKHPGATNLRLEGGTESVSALRATSGEVILITDLLGFGFNPVTGDWSRGAAGILLRDGEPAGALSGFTLAGNLREFLPRLVAGDDLSDREGVNAPSLFVPGLALAGA